MAKRGRSVRQASPVVARRQRERVTDTHASERLLSDVRRRLGTLENVLTTSAADLGVRSRRGGWHAVRIAGAGLAAMPTAGFSAAKVVAHAADGAAQRSASLSERAREFADDLPASRRHRRRAMKRTVGWSVAAFGAGAVVGWMLARREDVDPIQQARAAWEAAQGDGSETAPFRGPPSSTPAGPGDHAGAEVADDGRTPGTEHEAGE